MPVPSQRTFTFIIIPVSRTLQNMHATIWSQVRLFITTSMEKYQLRARRTLTKILQIIGTLQTGSLKRGDAATVAH